MFHYVKAFGWATLIIAIAATSRMGLVTKEAAEWLMMAALLIWVAISVPGNCAGLRVPRN